MKFGVFHDLLQRRGYTRPFRGAIESWSYTPPDDTHRVAGIVRARLAERLGRLPPDQAGRM